MDEVNQVDWALDLTLVLYSAGMPVETKWMRRGAMRSRRIALVLRRMIFFLEED